MAKLKKILYYILKWYQRINHYFWLLVIAILLEYLVEFIIYVPLGGGNWLIIITFVIFMEVALRQIRKKWENKKVK